MLKVSSGVFVVTCLVASVSSRNAVAGAENVYLDSGANRMLVSSDTQFALQAAQQSAADLRLGELAAAKASHSDVKSFGQQLVESHSAFDKQLQVIARSERMTLPDTIPARDEALYRKVQPLSGAAFDKAFVSRLVKERTARRKAYQKEASKGKDPLIREFATQQMPLVEQQLSRLKSIQPGTRLNRN